MCFCSVMSMIEMKKKKRNKRIELRSFSSIIAALVENLFKRRTLQMQIVYELSEIKLCSCRLKLNQTYSRASRFKILKYCQSVDFVWLFAGALED